MVDPACHDPAVAAIRVRELADQQRFALCEIAPAKASDQTDFIRDWLDADTHGEMHYLANHLEQRLDPQRFLPGAKSIICVADRYPDQPSDSAQGSAAAGKVARYAWGEDYHQTIKKRLHRMADALSEVWPDHTFRAAVDTAPVLEREHAQRAGMGWIGKHTLVIHPQFGSWLLLGEIVTTLPLQTSEQLDRGPMADHCGTCTRCIDACPTDCITPYQLDAKRCISYLTLEHRGPIDSDLHELMGDWVAGCDICQEVCPHNRQRDTPHEAMVDAYAPRDYSTGLPLLELLGWTAEDRQRVFTKSALKRMKLDQIRRNAIIAAGNYLASHDSPALRAKLVAIADDAGESEIVRTTAQQVCARLGISSDGL